MSLASKHENTQVLLTELGVWVLTNLKVHFEVTTTLVTTQFQPYLILRDSSMMPGECTLPADEKQLMYAYFVEPDQVCLTCHSAPEVE
mgnify:CR=1 FL=1